MANECTQCKGKFGMSRHYWFKLSFCKLVCKETFLKQRQQQINIGLYLKERPPDQYELPLQKPPD